VSCWLGGLTGLLLAAWWIGLMKAISPDYLYRFGEVKLDTRALLFVFAFTALVSLLSGLLPALNLSRLSTRLQDQVDVPGQLAGHANERSPPLWPVK
jgi:ABC-type lipoprotein release transport system permease subunit